MKTIIYSLSILIVITTALPYIRHEAWWIRIFDFVRFQILIISIPTILLGLYFLDLTTVDVLCPFVVFVCALLQIRRVFPYTFFAHKEVKGVRDKEVEEDEKKLSLIVCNVYMYNSKYMKVVKLIEDKQPDFLLLLEPNKFWTESIDPFMSDYRYKVLHPKEDTYGIALFSKKELDNVELRFLTDKEVPSIRANVKMSDGRWFDLYCVHPKPPFPSEHDSSLQRDVELIKIGKEIKKNKRPTILVGDLNDVAWSRTTRLFQKISGALDPRIGRGFFSTYHADVIFFRWPLDHVFHSKEFRLHKLKTLHHVGSDHFPIYTELFFDAGNENERAERPDEEEQEVIEDKLEEYKS